jgi:hypothetical protein
MAIKVIIFALFSYVNDTVYKSTDSSKNITVRTLPATTPLDTTHWLGNKIRMVLKPGRLILGLSLAACLLAGCTSFDEDKFDKQVKHWVPLGTPLAEARHTMEKHGFDCEVVRKDNPFNHGGLDSLECDKTEVLFHTWSATFILTGDKVTGYGATSVE